MDIFLWYETFVQAKMAIPLWYAILSGGVIVTWLLFYFGIWLCRIAWMRSSYFILKHFVYPHLFKRLPFIGAITRSETLMGILYISGNILCITIGTASTAEISARTATMSAINLIPLLCGPRLILMTELLGISLRGHFGFHKWVGRTAMTQVLLHTILSVINNQPFSWTSLNLAGVIASSSLGLLFIFSLHFVRRIAYEWFLRSHLVLTVAILVALWFHLASKTFVARIFLQIGISLWTAMTIIHGMYFIFRNFAWGKSLATARVTELSGVIQVVVITVPRPWHVKAGQYIFLSIPAAGITSALQSHPFMIVWWERDVDGLTIFLLVKPRRGFTNQLGRLGDRKVLALVDGPYGVKYDFGEYGTVLMFATGIGIAGHILYIKDLVSGYNSCNVRTRRIILIWQLDNEAHLQWVKQWMDDIIKMDTGYILKTSLYIRERPAPKTYQMDIEDARDDSTLAYPKVVPYGSHKKLDKISGSADVVGILKAEFKANRGEMIVSVCSNNIMADQVRNEVQKNMNTNIRLVELDFQPSLRQSGKNNMNFSYRGMDESSLRQNEKNNMEFNCRGMDEKQN